MTRVTEGQGTEGRRGGGVEGWKSRDNAPRRAITVRPSSVVRAIVGTVAGISSLIVWREAAELAVRVESAAKQLTGPLARSSAEQMVRAADSIAANIAEGYGRGVTRDGLRFLTIAHASADELEGHLRLAGMKRRLPSTLAAELVSHTRRTGFLLYRFQQSVERRLR